MTQNNEAKILTPEQIENNKQQIIDIYRNYVKREGSDKLLDYLINKSDFFTAPASTRFHGAYDGVDIGIDIRLRLVHARR